MSKFERAKKADLYALQQIHPDMRHKWVCGQIGQILHTDDHMRVKLSKIEALISAIEMTGKE